MCYCDPGMRGDFASFTCDPDCCDDDNIVGCISQYSNLNACADQICGD